MAGPRSNYQLSDGLDVVFAAAVVVVDVVVVAVVAVVAVVVEDLN